MNRGMETKKFKDLSSFGFYVGKEKTTTDELSYTDKENHTDSVIAIETNTSLNAIDSRFLCPTNNLASLTDPKATTTVTETSSSLQSSASKNDIGNHINGRLSLSDDVRYLLFKQHFVPDGRFEWPFAERKTNNTIERRLLRQKHLEERAMDQVRQNTYGVNVSGILINNLRLADDIDLIDEDLSSLQR
ncbi:unnamed protein product [Adineta ricciae]|uniref:Uncharacterized protein n=1 Tax=Adineta ricciae TaxID=249248 RepID=A0A815ZWV0_ADIRI|nr:unnamed protein product [Adineta ricciae]